MLKTEDENGNVIYHYKPLPEYKGGINFNGHKGCTVFLAPNARLEEGSISICGDNAAVFIGNARLGRATVSVYQDCTFYIGNNGYINGYGERQRIQIAEKTSVIIGDRCWLSYPLEISTSDVHLIYDISTRRRINQSASIFIGDHVWIGRDVRIYKGAKVSSGSIIATKAFLSSKVYPAHSVIAGVPGRALRVGEVFWDGHSSLIFSESDTEHYAELSENDPIVKQFIYKHDDNQTITPEDIDYNLARLKHSSERIAWLYDILFITDKHNRFVWKDVSPPTHIIPAGNIFLKETSKINHQPAVPDAPKEALSAFVLLQGIYKRIICTTVPFLRRPPDTK